MPSKKIFYLLAIMLFLIPGLMAQEIVVNNSGDSIVLYPNGTWDYYENFLSDKTPSDEDLRINPNTFKRSTMATRKMDGISDMFEVWYNPKVWRRIPPGDLNAEADLAFSMIDGDAYSMLIYEEVYIPVYNLTEIAYTNALNVAPDMEIIDREYRIVNNDTLIWMRMDGSTQGMEISYYSYYYSNDQGTIQYHTFTGRNLIKKFEASFLGLLNGLIIKQEDALQEPVNKLTK